MNNDIVEVSSISAKTLLQSRLHMVRNCQTHLLWNTINVFPYFLCLLYGTVLDLFA
nr:unnamed protein product [Callosobruchus analis]